MRRKEFRQNYQDHRKEKPKDLSELVWKTLDGQFLKVKEMDTGHLINCLFMLRNNGWNKLKCLVMDKEYLGWCIEAFDYELTKRGWNDWYLFTDEVD